VITCSADGWGITFKLDLATTQCPLCFHTVPFDGWSIIGECPNCSRDTRWAIFRIRYPLWHAMVCLLPPGVVNLQHADQFPH
jgi:hypothetical protein